MLVIVVVESLDVEAYSFAEDKPITSFEDTFMIVTCVQGIVGIAWNMDFAKVYFHVFPCHPCCDGWFENL